jgi:hypothetical protein
MYKNISFLHIAVALLLMLSCKKEEVKQDFSASANAVYITFSDGSGFFSPEKATPYGDTIRFVFSTNYPVATNTPINITSMKIKANAPTTVKVAATGSDIADLTRPTEIIVRSADGTERKHILVGEIRKSNEAMITSFALPSVNITGFLLESQKIVGLVSGGANLVNQVPVLTITPHATISPAITVAQDFSKPVTYTVTAENGTSVQYVVKSITPQRVASGIRAGSQKLLWTKSLVELGINGIDNFTTSIAVTENYLMVNTRTAANKYLDRYTGALLGTVTPTPVLSTQFPNFFATSDETGHILVTNLVNGLPNTLYVYKYNDATDLAPVKFIEWPSTAYLAGRKMSVKGDLNKNALIFMGAPNSNNTILRWQVVNGALVSQIPTLITYGGSKIWTLMGDVIATGTNLTDNLFVAGQSSDLAYMNVATGQPISTVDLTASGIAITHSIDYTEFNSARYLAAINVGSTITCNAFLYNVTDPLLLSTPPSAANYNSVCVFKSPVLVNVANGNLTGDVALKVSKDGYKMIMYVLITNGSIAAYEFDCIDLTSIR